MTAEIIPFPTAHADAPCDTELTFDNVKPATIDRVRWREFLRQMGWEDMIEDDDDA